jgi:hypothetical protein
MLIATQSEVIGLLMQSLREQVEVGQVTVVENDERTISRTIKSGPNPALVTATNQALSRLASLMGLDVAADVSVNVTTLSADARASLAPLDPSSYLQMLASGNGGFPAAITTPPPLQSAAIPAEATEVPPEALEAPEAVSVPSTAPLRPPGGPGMTIRAHIELPPLQEPPEAPQGPPAAPQPRIKRHPRPRAF